MKPGWQSGSAMRCSIIAITNSSRTSPPVFMTAAASLPTSVPIATARLRASPVDNCGIPNAAASLGPWVPLPDPGGPKRIRTLRAWEEEARAAILRRSAKLATPRDPGRAWAAADSAEDHSISSPEVGHELPISADITVRATSHAPRSPSCASLPSRANTAGAERAVVRACKCHRSNPDALRRRAKWQQCGYPPGVPCRGNVDPARLAASARTDPNTSRPPAAAANPRATHVSNPDATIGTRRGPAAAKALRRAFRCACGRGREGGRWSVHAVAVRWGLSPMGRRRTPAVALRLGGGGAPKRSAIVILVAFSSARLLAILACAAFARGPKVRPSALWGGGAG
eukprot:Hpha_TRINITY_DN8747_c0_g1::TRINITY_DN8747_c0_g1_i1::g.45445::m.45445